MITVVGVNLTSVLVRSLTNVECLEVSQKALLSFTSDLASLAHPAQCCSGVCLPTALWHGTHKLAGLTTSLNLFAGNVRACLIPGALLDMASMMTWNLEVISAAWPPFFWSAPVVCLILYQLPGTLCFTSV